MKKAITILKQINELEKELFRNYTHREIQTAFDKLDKEGYRYIPESAIYMIGTGVDLYIELEEACEEIEKEKNSEQSI